jgi:NAD(P)-dependent dehydrogenase (short-subunit alcohol dehydrogenase family)
MGELDGVVAVITGAANGIGREHALRFAREGARVVVNDVADPEPVVASITAVGGTAVGCRVDVTTSEGAQALVESAIEHFGGLDALVNNAGGGSTALATDVTDEAWEYELRLNLSGMFHPTRAALRWWQAQRRKEGTISASIVNTSSGAGLFGNAGQSPYGAAKAGVAAFTVIAATELAGTGIRVNAIAPAARTETALESSGVIGRLMGAPADPAAFDAWHPAQVSPLVVYLSCRDCPFTGEVFHVRGGVVGHFEGWTIGGTVQADHELTVGELRSALPSLVAAAPSRAEAGGAAYSSLRNAWSEAQMAGSEAQMAGSEAQMAGSERQPAAGESG